MYISMFKYRVITMHISYIRCVYGTLSNQSFLSVPLSVMLISSSATLEHLLRYKNKSNGEIELVRNSFASVLIDWQYEFVMKY